jgi:hypothetical protein
VKRLALLLLPVAALAGLAAWFFRPTPQAPLPPGVPPAPLAPEPVPEPAAPVAEAEPAEEPLPDEPVVNVKVAPDAAAPLLWFRGASAESAGALLWSHPKQRKKTVSVLDGQVALRAADKPAAVRRGPLALAGGPAAGPMLVSVGAKWCKPCMAELGDLLELAEQVTNTPRTGTGGSKTADQRPRLALILQDEASEWTMAEVRDRFFADYNSKFRKGKSALKAPAWLEVRADLESQWGRALEVLKLLGSGPVTLPVNFLVDGCGHIHAIASGSLDANKRAQFVAAAARLQTATCVAMPVPVAAPRARPAAGPVTRPAGASAPAGSAGSPAPSGLGEVVDRAADPAATKDPAGAGTTEPAGTDAKPVVPAEAKPVDLPAAGTRAGAGTGTGTGAATGAGKPSTRPPGAKTSK